MKYIILLMFFFHFGHSQNLELKMEAFVKNHVENFKKSNKSFDNLIISYENVGFSKIEKISNIIVLNEKGNLKKYIKKNTVLINFKMVIKENKLFIIAIHFRLKKIKKGIEYINQMDGTEYYICDLEEKPVGNIKN